MGARSRSGCLACRRRKKKCDEEKPICMACLRNNLGCVWPGSSSRDGNFAMRLQGLGTRAAIQLNEWALASGSMHPNMPAGTIPPTPYQFMLPGSIASSPETWTLLDHYLQDTANHLTCLQDSQNPFLHTILPAAHNDELLMNSILALSGVHMMQRLPSLSQDIQTLTWSSYTRALKQLRVALSTLSSDTNGDDAAWRILLVVLIFYLLEVGLALSFLLRILLIRIKATRGIDSEAMQRHLDGAHHLMAHLVHSTSSRPHSNIVSLTTDLFVYNASLATFTTGRTISPSISNLLDAPGSLIRDTGAMCGCAYELFLHIPMVSALLWDFASYETTGPPPGYFATSYCDLRSQIKKWKPRSAQQDLVLCAELYQQSLLLLLDYHFAGDRIEELKERAFRDLESILSRLPPNSSISTTATWPLFVFGLMAPSDDCKILIRLYLQSLVEIFGMGVMSTALSQLEEIWEVNPGRDVLSRFFINQNNLLLIC
ncbi:hypothetical protein N7540_000883 [Penicillium herquei]|nr:hypothetical protein N7540_000883 [Penicillium herquei]